MKQQHCLYACDQEGCDEESPPESTFEEARRIARSSGWQFTIVQLGTGMLGAPIRQEAQFCPQHHR